MYGPKRITINRKNEISTIGGRSSAQQVGVLMQKDWISRPRTYHVYLMNGHMIAEVKTKKDARVAMANELKKNDLF